MANDSLHRKLLFCISCPLTGGHGTDLANWDSQKVFIDASVQVINRHNRLTHNAGVQVAMAVDHLYAGMYEHLLAVPVCKVGVATTCGCRASAYRSLCY